MARPARRSRGDDDRFDPAALLVLAWSQVHSLLGFYLIWAGIGVASAMVLYEPAFVAVANWFSRYRPRALMGLTFAAGWSTVIFVSLSSWLVQAHGWRTALVILATLLGVVTVPLHALTLRRRPRDLGLAIDGGSEDESDRPVRVRSITGVSFHAAVRQAGFWWLGLAYFLAVLTSVALAIHIIPLLTERGYSASFAALIAAAIGLTTMPGRLVILPLGERIDIRFLAAAIFALQGLGLLVLLHNRSRQSIWIFVLLFGAGMGAISASRAAIVADAYGPSAYGAINGALAFLTMLARALAPIGGSLVHDHLGGYRAMLMILTGGCADRGVRDLTGGSNP